MCGIFGYLGKGNAARIVFEGLKNLEYRGYDSWGIAIKAQNAKSKIQNGEKLLVEKHVGKIVNLTLEFKSQTLNSHCGIGHCRWATHGGVTEANAHPHLDCTRNLAVVHNGIIENFLELKKDLQKTGHKFRSETDTEVFAHLVEDYSKAGFLEAVKAAFKKLAGRNAFVVVNATDQVVVGLRNGSPLIFGLGESEYFLASDIPAFLKHTKNVVFLNDFQGVVLGKNHWEVFDLKNRKTPKTKIEKIDWKPTQAAKGEYPHFLLKEILEQPQTINAAAQQNETEIKKLASMIKAAFGSYLIACGTASYAALFGTYVFSAIAKKHINWTIGSEFTNYQHFLTPKSLVIAVSQSGETADILEACEIAKSAKAKTVAIVNVAGSTLTRLANYSVLTNAGPEIAVVSTKAFTAQLAVLLLLAYAVAGKLRAGKRIVEKTAKLLETMLTDNFLKKLKLISSKLKNSKHIYVIGKGQNYPIALEAALKIKEASYIHGEGFASGELKHGVIALIEKDTPCVVLFSADEDCDYIFSSAAEMKARGGLIIGIGPEDNEVFDEAIIVPDIPEAGAIINTPPVQLLAYYLATEKGLDPDKPRNLAKSVTVK